MQAFIFDFDGVILDSQKHWDRCTLEHFRSLVPTWSEEDNQKQKGMSVSAAYKLLVRDYGLTHSHDEFLASLDTFVHELYDTSRIIDGIAAFLERLRHMNIPIGIATATQRHWLMPVLEKHDIGRYFDAISSANDVEESKPHPEVYLKTAKELGADPKQCVALEDSTQGLTSAKAAGMFAIALETPEHLHRREDTSIADMLIHHPDELTEEVLRRL